MEEIGYPAAQSTHGRHHCRLVQCPYVIPRFHGTRVQVMKVNNFLLRPAILLACLLSLVAGPGSAAAQNDGGDQFLDGIGETALVARYLLNGTAADGSRNGHQATLRGTGAAYVED